VSSKKVKRKAKQVDECGWATRFHEPSSNSVKQDSSLLLGANKGVQLNCSVLKVLISECISGIQRKKKFMLQ
jgi:hypothetical protein